MVEQVIEPEVIYNPDKMVMGVNQTSTLCVDPAYVLPVDRQGLFLKRRLPKEEIIVSRYWQHQRKGIALLGSFSSFVLFAMLANETNLFNIIFSGVLGIFGFIWGLVL